MTAASPGGQTGSRSALGFLYVAVDTRQQLVYICSPLLRSAASLTPGHGVYLPWFRLPQDIPLKPEAMRTATGSSASWWASAHAVGSSLLTLSQPFHPSSLADSALWTSSPSIRR